MNAPILQLKDMKAYYFSLIIAMLGISTYFGLSQSIVIFEKGIEIVRSRGYIVNREMEWDLTYSEVGTATEQGLHPFLDACSKIQREYGVVTVYTEYYNKVLFLFVPTSDLSETSSISVTWPRERSSIISLLIGRWL